MRINLSQFYNLKMQERKCVKMQICKNAKMFFAFALQKYKTVQMQIIAPTPRKMWKCKQKAKMQTPHFSRFHSLLSLVKAQLRRPRHICQIKQRSRVRLWDVVKCKKVMWEYLWKSKICLIIIFLKKRASVLLMLKGFCFFFQHKKIFKHTGFVDALKIYCFNLKGLF